MTATEELRGLLDERGVEYETYTESIGIEHVIWHPNETSRWDWNEEFGTGWISGYQSDVTPQQVIAATLGRERTCTMQLTDLSSGSAYHDVWLCGACGEQVEQHTVMDKSEPPRYCPNCGAKVVDE